MIKKYFNDFLICIKRFPREFNETTIINIDGYCGGSGSAVRMRDYLDVLDSNNMI